MPRRSREWRSRFWLEEEESDDRYEVMFAGPVPAAAESVVPSRGNQEQALTWI